MAPRCFAPPGARATLIAASLALLSGCGATPAGPTPPVVAQLELTRPSDVRVDNVVGAALPVTYSVPQSSGGVAPIAITCSPASGAIFPIGSTTVSCSGADAAAPPRTATTSFTVTLVPFVPPVPVLGATKFMAFGDSITAGEVNDDSGPTCNDPAHPAGLALWNSLIGIRSVQSDLAYPKDLERLLAARYTGQTFVVNNEGEPLDDTGDTGRFAAVVAADRPQAVLLMQGIIDLAGGQFGAIPGISRNLDTDINEARRQGVTSIFLSTLPPVVYEARGCFLTNPAIRAANDAIRVLAAQDNVYLVDGYAAIAGQESTLMGSDGLHPTPAGYQALANAFFSVIRNKLELAAAPGAVRRR